MQKKNLPYIYSAAAAGIWIYLMLRAVYVPPVHDEAATFFHYINHGEYMPGKALWDANNHILNSFLSKYFVKLFGIGTFTIRLANLLFFPVYAYFLYRLSTLLRSERSRFVLLLTGLTIHGFIEYFAYSRGYGMSMALLAGALYYSYRFFADRNVHLLLPAVLLYAAATLSNLTLQNSTLLFLAAAACYLAVEKFTAAQRVAASAYLLLGAAAVWPLAGLSLQMKKDGLLYYAADEDFWTAVITSFSQQYFDAKNSFGIHLFWLAWSGLSVWLTIGFLARLRRNRTEDRARLLFPLLFFGNLAGIFAMHYLLGVNYPSDRTGMYLVLYLFLACIFLADAGTPLQQTAALVPALVFFVQFSLGANLKYSTYWKGEHLPERFWERVRQESADGLHPADPTVGGYRIRNLVWAWYNFRHGGPLQNMQYPDYYKGFEDYQVFSAGDFEKYKDTYDLLDTDEISGVTLGRRKTPVHTEPYFDTTVAASPENYTGEYYTLFESLQPDSFVGRSLLLETEIRLSSPVKPPKIHLVTTFSDADGRTLGYETSPLHWLKKEFGPQDGPVTCKIWWYKVPAETRRMVVYLWNVDQKPYTLHAASLHIRKAVPL